MDTGNNPTLAVYFVSEPAGRVREIWTTEEGRVSDKMIRRNPILNQEREIKSEVEKYLRVTKFIVSRHYIVTFHTCIFEAVFRLFNKNVYLVQNCIYFAD